MNTLSHLDPIMASSSKLEPFNALNVNNQLPPGTFREQNIQKPTAHRSKVVPLQHGPPLESSTSSARSARMPAESGGIRTGELLPWPIVAAHRSENARICDSTQGTPALTVLHAASPVPSCSGIGTRIWSPMEAASLNSSFDNCCILARVEQNQVQTCKTVFTCVG